tara:strand:+ start:7 stop:411 length:405 start_codon:yes stop_codon:yes gene_type:complete
MVTNEKDFIIINKAIYDNRPIEDDFARMMTEDRNTRFILEGGKIALEREYSIKRYSKKVYDYKKLNLFTKITDRVINEFVKKIIIINNILVFEIKKYWKEKNSYEYIMKELDSLLWKPKPCNCRNIRFGFCFHR